ncbi:MAG: hypothetical protein ABSF94_13035 [Steroidobacteraceae bacterium]
MPNRDIARVDRGNGQPSWGYLIALALIAIGFINLLAVTVVLLIQPTPERYWFLGIVWVIALGGLTRLPNLRRMIETPRTPPRRGPPI